MKKCILCGELNPIENKRCQHCGNDLSPHIIVIKQKYDIPFNYTSFTRIFDSCEEDRFTLILEYEHFNVYFDNYLKRYYYVETGINDCCDFAEVILSLSYKYKVNDDTSNFNFRKAENEHEITGERVTDDYIEFMAFDSKKGGRFEDIVVSPCEYLHMVTGNRYYGNTNDDAHFIEERLHEAGYNLDDGESQQLFDYYINEVSEIIENNLHVVLVMLNYSKEQESQVSWRWFELPR